MSIEASNVVTTMKQALEALEAEFAQNTRYSSAKRSANATCAEFKNSSLSALIESGYMTSIGANTERAITSLRTAIASYSQAIATAVAEPHKESSNTANAAATQEPVAYMRMPKVGDRVVCIEDEDFGTVQSLTAGSSPDIKFDDGSYGTYLLREFAELFRYADTHPPQRSEDAKQPKAEQEPEQWAMAFIEKMLEQTPAHSLLASQVFHELHKQLNERVYTHPQPKAEQDDPDDLTIAYMSGLHKGKELAEQEPKREWVGLTDEEIDDAAHCCVKSGQSVNAAIRAIEAKLKEKNT